ncbi:leucine-rich repeat domain-containing protein [Aquimarina sp. RZ0]|uniref:leucine-rich repeat domain-containing protein n=1 Tax=Aquimarina sp. RZ0 TaxID=2607730 RepID=UPI0011F2F3CC|nr:leucine-rich repeat domain-containing protein [Aquimarina sp. RZ0]KAA1245831.1 leucine-rich repeat domain-containing protein [Aquimarina sp. RZ0]
MYLTGNEKDPYLRIKSNSNLNEVKEEFLTGKYSVRLSEEFSEEFLEEFMRKFYKINSLNLSDCYNYKVKNSFVYAMQNLNSLSISVWKDTDFILDCTTLPKSITTLWFTVYTKKKIINLDSINSHVENLIISGFDEKDLIKLSNLTNLKSLSFATAKIKSLKGIEKLTKLEYLSLGGVRSLTDITDITTLQKLERLEFDICWKLKDFSAIGELKALKELKLLDCKNLESIKFVKGLPNLKSLSTLGTTIINDFDTTPAEHVPIFFGSQYKKYNKQYPEKEIHKKLDEL